MVEAFRLSERLLYSVLDGLRHSYSPSRLEFGKSDLSAELPERTQSSTSLCLNILAPTEPMGGHLPLFNPLADCLVADVQVLADILNRQPSLICHLCLPPLK